MKLSEIIKNTIFLLPMIILFTMSLFEKNFLVAVLFLILILYYCKKSRRYILSKLHLREPKPLFNTIIILVLFIIATGCKANTSTKLTSNNNYLASTSTKDPNINSNDNEKNDENSEDEDVNEPSIIPSTVPSTVPSGNSSVSSNSNSPNQKNTNESKTNNKSNKKNTNEPKNTNNKSNKNKSIVKPTDKAVKATKTPVKTPTQNTSKAKTNTSTPKKVNKTIPNTTNNQSETVYITDTGKKYHAKGCRYLKQSSHPISSEKARSMGYTPCSVCH